MVVMEDEGDKNDVLRQKRGGGERRYVYDAVFGEDSTQDMVYEATSRGLVLGVLMGYNATVFAYGATGSGKTHTMVGNSEQPGIMVRALNDIFQAVKDSANPEQFTVTMSYLEIYNENIRDLLNPSSGFLELREDSRGRNIQVKHLSEISTTSTEEVMCLLQKGNRARTVEPTAANKTSSRSHALLSVTVQQTSPLQTVDKMKSRIKHGKLFMIDLAGSERASQTKNRGKRLKEGAHINRSLLALGNCINALSGGAHYVNYRDSKLTRLLKDALSGNCKTVMIAHVSPAAVHKEESRNTLLYADRAKNISNKVERNVLDVSYHVSQYRNIISELRDEIARLRSKMKEDRTHLGDASNEKGEKLKILRDQIVSTFREQMRLRRRLMEYDSRLLSLSAEAERQHAVISQWESKNNKLYKNNHNTLTRWHDRRPNTEPDFDVDREFLNMEDDGPLQMAWSELSFIEKEQEQYAELRASTEHELEDCRQRGAALENELPSQISSEEERELLALMCRVHELEVEKMALQSERFIKQHELWRRDLVIFRYDRQRHLCEEIITRQRQLMEEGCVTLPQDLKELYRIYQQEIHASTYTDASPSYQSGVPFSSYTRDKGKLPPIQPSAEPLFHRSMRYTADHGSDQAGSDDISMRTPNSSAGSDYTPSPLPPIPGSAGTGQMGQLSSLPPPAVLFPPIAGPTKGLPDTSKYLSRYV
ncbi:kinesin-like protein KIF19 isoform X3 [Cryptotermes secundus]|nr:kinesin-like protein KIF19 isoform X3 [Cryptotermes secundus]XP_033609065.1 kinesin-like protein KIF19 isoform X3 [Cryptotermes secundus]